MKQKKLLVVGLIVFVALVAVGVSVYWNMVTLPTKSKAFSPGVATNLLPKPTSNQECMCQCMRKINKENVLLCVKADNGAEKCESKHDFVSRPKSGVCADRNINNSSPDNKCSGWLVNNDGSIDVFKKINDGRWVCTDSIFSGGNPILPSVPSANSNVR